MKCKAVEASKSTQMWDFFNNTPLHYLATVFISVCILSVVESGQSDSDTHVGSKV